MSNGRRLQVVRKPVKDTKVKNDVDVKNSAVTWAGDRGKVLSEVRKLPGVVSVMWV